MWAGGILFYMNTFVGGQTAAVIVYERLNVIIATDGASPYNIALGFSSIEWGKLFTSGFDFSAVTAAGGNSGLIVIQGILTFLALGIYGNAANLHDAEVLHRIAHIRIVETAFLPALGDHSG